MSESPKPHRIRSLSEELLKTAGDMSELAWEKHVMPLLEEFIEAEVGWRLEGERSSQADSEPTPVETPFVPTDPDFPITETLEDAIQRGYIVGSRQPEWFLDYHTHCFRNRKSVIRVFAFHDSYGWPTSRFIVAWDHTLLVGRPGPVEHVSPPLTRARAKLLLQALQDELPDYEGSPGGDIKDWRWFNHLVRAVLKQKLPTSE